MPDTNQWVHTGMGFNCTAVNIYLQDLQNRVCYDFLYELEGYALMRYSETVDGKVVVYNDYTNIGSGLIGNGGIRLTAMYVTITAILTWLSVIGTLGLKDGWALNRGAEIVDVSEVRLVKQAEQGLGKKTDIESLGEGWVHDLSSGNLKKNKKKQQNVANVSYSEKEPPKQPT